MDAHAQKRALRTKRQHRIKAKISGTGDRPRMAVFRSNTTLYVQVIDDANGKTIVSQKVVGKNKEAAAKLGAQIATILKEKGITTIVFDRGGYQFHGTIKELAEAARSGGLKF